MTKFTWGDYVRIKDDAPAELKPGKAASIFAVVDTLERERQGHDSFWTQFPPGVIHGVEFEDGSDVYLHEDFLEHAEPA